MFCDVLRPQYVLKRQLLSVVCLLIAIFGASASSTQAQITSDGTLSTTVTSSDGQNFVIEAGDRTGNNLFHSFSEFSIPTNGSAIFNNATDIENIFSRVTSFEVSNIDGLIQVNGIANVFLLNPNGIFFGENASLNIGGSLVASTAESVLFSDAIEFRATEASPVPLLTISTPVGLGLGPNSGPITVAGAGHNLVLDFSTVAPIRDNRPIGLQVDSGETLALIGRDILVEGGNLTANQGRIELGSVAQTGTVSLIPATNGFTVDYSTIDSFGNLTFTQAASVDVSGEGSGNLHFQAGNLAILEASAIISNVLGAEQGLDVHVRASESVEIRGSQTGDFPSAFFNQGELDSTGNVGNLLIETAILEIADGAFVSNSISGAGNGGNLTIIANTVENNNNSFAEYGTGLYAQVLSNGIGRGGELFIDVETLRLTGGTQISNTTFGPGNGGPTTIQANQIDLIGVTPSGDFSSGIFADTSAEGDAGAIDIQADTLTVLEGGLIASGTFGQGNGGDITIQANEIDLAGASPSGDFVSSILADTQPEASGIGGTIDLKVENLLRVRAGAQIVTAAFGTGDAGDILLQANEIEVSGVSDTGENISLIAASSLTEASANKINITAQELRVSDQARISVSGLNLGDASDLTIMADQIRLTDGGRLQAEVAAGNQGNIFLMADSLLLMLRGALISTNAANEATGGNIIIEAPVILGLGNSDIVSNAVQGDGGNIAITTQALLGLQFRDFQTPENDITASSQAGVNGLVQINTAELEPRQDRITLTSELIDSSDQVSTSCLVAADNSFTVSGRSGLPNSPDISNSFAVWEDWRPLETEVGLATIATPVETASFVEATDVLIATNGQVDFVAKSEGLMSPNQMSCGGRR